jgi:hypothetical protein
MSGGTRKVIMDLREELRKKEKNEQEIEETITRGD